MHVSCTLGSAGVGSSLWPSLGALRENVPCASQLERIGRAGGLGGGGGVGVAVHPPRGGFARGRKFGLPHAGRRLGELLHRIRGGGIRNFVVAGAAGQDQRGSQQGKDDQVLQGVVLPDNQGLVWSAGRRRAPSLDLRESRPLSMLCQGSGHENPIKHPGPGIAYEVL